MKQSKFISFSWSWFIILTMYALYSVQGIIFSTGGIIPQALLLGIILFGLYSLITVFGKQHAISPLKWAFIMLCLLCLTYIISPKTVAGTGYIGELDTFSQLKGSIIFLLSFFIGFNIGETKVISKNEMALSMIIITIIALLLFYDFYYTQSIMNGLKDATNNYAYNFLYALPYAFLLLKSRKTLAITIIVTIVVFVISGAKRGAIVSMGAMGLYYIWWLYKYTKIDFKVFLSLIIVTSALIFYINYAFEHSDYLQLRLQNTLNGDSSSRDSIYSTLWTHWYFNADFFTVIFGNGTAQTVNIAGNYAHNDWLELLTNNGIVGVVIYCGLLISIINFINRINPTPHVRLCLLSAIILWFCKTIFSMGYTSISGGLSTMLLGLLLGNMRLKSKYSNIATLNNYYETI